jgi:transcriptional regulator with XRE-family HTH domain
MALTTTKERQEIGARLCAERERLGYSEEQIAQLLGVPLEHYQRMEVGEVDPGIFRMPRLTSVGFDILFIINDQRYIPGHEENILLERFRLLSMRGKASLFTTLDALERLAPNLKQKIRNATRNHD